MCPSTNMIGSPIVYYLDYRISSSSGSLSSDWNDICDEESAIFKSGSLLSPVFLLMPPAITALPGA